MALLLGALAAVFSLLDAATTYACLQYPWLAELNPYARLLFKALGVEAGLVLGFAVRCAGVACVLGLHRVSRGTSVRSACCFTLAAWACIGLACSVNNLLHLLLVDV